MRRDKDDQPAGKGEFLRHHYHEYLGDEAKNQFVGSGLIRALNLPQCAVHIFMMHLAIVLHVERWSRRHRRVDQHLHKVFQEIRVLMEVIDEDVGLCGYLAERERRSFDSTTCGTVGVDRALEEASLCHLR